VLNAGRRHDAKGIGFVGAALARSGTDAIATAPGPFPNVLTDQTGRWCSLPIMRIHVPSPV
jgi:hypothetical protein